MLYLSISLFFPSRCMPLPEYKIVTIHTSCGPPITHVFRLPNTRLIPTVLLNTYLYIYTQCVARARLNQNQWNHQTIKHSRSWERHGIRPDRDRESECHRASATSSTEWVFIYICVYLFSNPQTDHEGGSAESCSIQNMCSLLYRYAACRIWAKWSI